MRRPAVPALLALLLLVTPPPGAQGDTPLARTLTLPAPSEDAAALHLRPQLVTTLELSFPVRETHLSGPGAEALTAQRLEPHIVSLYPARALAPGQRPVLTLTAEDGTRHAFPLVMDGPVDVKVRVREAPACPEPSSAEAALAIPLLLSGPAGGFEEVAYHYAPSSPTPSDAPALTLRGSLPLGRLAILVFHVTHPGEPFAIGRATLQAPSAVSLRVLGIRTGPSGDGALLIERPEDAAEGVEYTLRVFEKQGPRELVAPPFVPWPLPSIRKEDAQADPQLRPANGKLPRLKRLQPR
jgi:hypothetical protein